MTTIIIPNNPVFICIDLSKTGVPLYLGSFPIINGYEFGWLRDITMAMDNPNLFAVWLTKLHLHSYMFIIHINNMIHMIQLLKSMYIYNGFSVV